MWEAVLRGDLESSDDSSTLSAQTSKKDSKTRNDGVLKWLRGQFAKLLDVLGMRWFEPNRRRQYAVVAEW